MEDLEYRADYAGDARARKLLNDFILDVHGLDLTLWEERVGWDPGFVPFSFFDADGVVASTCIYTVPMILRGEWVRVAQISSVGTRESARRQGLNAELTRRALEWADATAHEGTFLFSDDDATEFYAKQGFVEWPEFNRVVEVTTTARPEFRRLSFDRDEDLLCRLVEGRTPVSLELGARCPRLELFHLLYENAGELRYVEEFDLLATVEEDGDVLIVYDLIGSELPVWQELEPRLLGSAIRSIRFDFIPDRLDLSEATCVETRSSRLHLLEGESLFGPRPMIPFTAHA